MSNINNENTKPIKPLSTEDTQPTRNDETWVNPVADEGATIPIPAGRKKKQQPVVSQSGLDEGVTIAVPAARKTKPKAESIRPGPYEDATVPLATRMKTEALSEAPQPAANNPMLPGTMPDQTPETLQTMRSIETGMVGFKEPPDGTETPTGKVKRGKWIWLGILGMIIIILIGGGIGYASAIRARIIEQNNQRLITATTQFELGLVDQREDRLEAAQTRFEYVLSIYPEFPGITDKLVEVGLAIAQAQGDVVVVSPGTDPEPDTVITPVATKDTTSVSILFNQAQNQLAASDWEGLYTTLDKMRYIDPEYESVKADGMLYLTLRNRGIAQIQAGHLEPGLYSFALASQIAPLDADAESYRTWAGMYLKASSYGLVDEFLGEAVQQFSVLHSLVPNLRDASGFTVSQRYAQALVNMGDFYQRNLDFCGAVPFYQQAASIYAIPSLAEKIPQAEEYCKNPPEVPTPTPDPSAPTATPEQG